MEKYCTVRIKNIKNCDMENIEMADGQTITQIEQSG